MKKILLLALMTISLFLSACQWSFSKDKPLVMTTLFPQYDFVRQIAGDLVELQYLLPPGTAAHSYEPTPLTVIKILNADLLIYTGDGMEPWVDTLIRSSASETLRILDLSANVALIEDDGDDHDDHDDHLVDPHIWQDPIIVKQMVQDILAELIILLPDKEATLTHNATNYSAQIDDLHAAYLDLVANSELSIIMHGGHNAFGYFAQRYGLEYITPYIGFSTDTEPTPQAIANMIDVMNLYGIEVLFSEKLISPEVASAIAEETDAIILYLYAAGNVPIDEYNAGITFLDMMYHNLEQLKIGLKYNAND